MRVCNWPQKRVLLPPEQRTFKRVHGLQFPLHHLQVLGWLVLTSISAGTFSTLIPLLGPKLKIPLLILVAVLLLFHVISHLVALLVDPAESQLRIQRNNFEKPEFDRSKHLHIIENGRCHLCNIDASGKRTKHCWDCNKCVVGFDHHCKWLNNCIGERNYAAFICCVVTAIASTLTVLAIVVTELTNVNAESGHSLKMDNSTLPRLVQLPDTSSLVVISVVGILSAIAAVLLIHLCLFHGYIACLGLTTYEYVRSRRAKAPIVATSGFKNSVAQFQCPDGQPVRYHFCESTSITENSQMDTSNVYICSTHIQKVNDTHDQKNERDRKQFHLYFSYETKANDTTSIELTSRTTRTSLVRDGLANLRPPELKPSTPSPVSCCFSIVNPSITHAYKKQNKKMSNKSLENEHVQRSCMTIRRIQTFLRTKLRKSARQRALNIETSGVRKNKVTPLTSPDTIENEDSVKSVYDGIKDDILQVRPPPKLPPLVLNSRHRSKQINHAHTPTTSVILKHNQQHMRMRKSALRKRHRFKISNHVTQSAQLSPIPESEQSKPVSPLSLPQSEHFTFSSVHNK